MTTVPHFCALDALAVVSLVMGAVVGWWVQQAGGAMTVTFQHPPRWYCPTCCAFIAEEHVINETHCLYRLTLGQRLRAWLDMDARHAAERCAVTEDWHRVFREDEVPPC